MSLNKQNPRPLENLKVLELGHILAGAFSATILGYFGAHVIKVEPPKSGDPIRTWRTVKDGTSLWWWSLGRNKKSITVNLKSEEGQKIIRDLCKHCDVLIENFRPGQMEDWNLGPEDIKKVNDRIIYTRISGYGQTGPYSKKPGFASVCEGFGGFRYLNGVPGELPVRPNLSLGDTLAGIHAALGVCMAYVRLLENEKESGQVVDVSIFESVFNMLEAVVPEYSGAGEIREPAGTTITEWIWRTTATDYIDDVSGYYVNSNLISDEADEMANQSTDEAIIGKRRGNPNNNDWYNFTGFTISYKIKNRPLKCPKELLP